MTDKSKILSFHMSNPSNDKQKVVSDLIKHLDKSLMDHLVIHKISPIDFADSIRDALIGFCTLHMLIMIKCIDYDEKKFINDCVDIFKINLEKNIDKNILRSCND